MTYPGLLADYLSITVIYIKIPNLFYFLRRWTRSPADGKAQFSFEGPDRAMRSLSEEGQNRQRRDYLSL